MHIDPDKRPEAVEIMGCRVNKLVARGASHRRAIRRIAGRHDVPPRQLAAMIARTDQVNEGGPV